MGYKVEVNEVRRTIVFTSGERLDLHKDAGWEMSSAQTRPVESANWEVGDY